MYIQQKFNETNVDTLHALIKAHPLGALVVLTDSGMEVNHMPFQLEAVSDGTVLRAHIPKGNTLWQQALDSKHEAVVIFQGPERYITPSWYPSKQEHGQVVPTWNYAVVHAYGQPRFVTDKEWLRAHVTALTNEHEASQALPWQVTDAPADYIDSMLEKIVGIELPVTRMLGKWKVSQNRPQADRMGVMAGLNSQQTESAAAMEALVKQHL
ncbi:MAG: FMN-binding negative transcriptional regulator [Pseudomonadota bacterium]